MKKIIFTILTLISIISFSQEKKYTTYRVTDNETITSIAKKLGITPYDLLKLNPDAKNGIDIDEVIIIPNKNYKPTSTVNNNSVEVKRYSYKDSIKDGILYHRVKFGETIYSLSRKYKVKKKKVLKLNNLKKRSKISINQVLKFPTKKADTFIKKSEVQVANSKIQNEFLDYTVKADDTKYSLARKHGVSVVELEKINPHLKGKTLNEYDVLLLPNTKYVIEEVIEPNTNLPNYRTHTVQPQETFFKLTRLYAVAKEELINLNPELVNGLKEGMLIKIPNTSNDIVFREPTFKLHTVKYQETIYSLTNLYRISEEELLQINPELKEGLKEGMLIKLPNNETEILLNLDTNFTGKQLEVVLLLPFKAKEKLDTSFKEDEKLNRITDFYLGSIMAMENLKAKGLSINLNVFDTKGDKATISNIINTHNFSNTDVIIGPLHYRNVAQIAKFFKNSNTPIISPVSNNNHYLLGSKNIIQNVASNKQLEDKMLNFIKNNYTNQNIIIVADDIKESKYKVTQLVNFLKLHDSINKVTILNMEDGYIKREKFIENINKKKENWVILASDDKSTTAITVDNLGVFTKEYKLTLFALNKGKNFKGIKNTFLNRVNLHYPTNEFVDKSNADLLSFNTNYKLKYGNEPSIFSYKGYDTTYDALMRIATYQNLKDSFQKGRTKGIANAYNYNTTSFSSPINNAIFVVKYLDFEIVKVE